MVVRGVFCSVFQGLFRTAILNMGKALETRLASSLLVNKNPDIRSRFLPTYVTMFN